VKHVPGHVLKIGAIVLQRKNETVLCIWAGRRENQCPFVTWRIDQEENVFLGHYFNSLDEALADFNARA
jgi:hypothetical protein